MSRTKNVEHSKNDAGRWRNAIRTAKMILAAGGGKDIQTEVLKHRPVSPRIGTEGLGKILEHLKVNEPQGGH